MSSPTVSEHVESTKSIQNLVALFHCSFHPTKGNVVDWSAKASDDITLDGVEFCVLPSGLHLVEKDVIYFTHASYTGIALFRRRPTRTVGHRGFRLSAFGILLSCYEKRPRPWLHLPAFQALVDTLYKSAGNRQPFDEDEERDVSGIAHVDWEIARVWFEERKIREKVSSVGYDVGIWRGWSDELDGAYASPYTPTHHLSHFLRLLGISSLTIYKHILARRRILILTLPPVEPACIFAWIAADMCRDYHGRAHTRNDDDPERILEDGPTVLGIVTLSDMDRLEVESRKGTGWIACTTDTIFLDKPSNYDLLIDFTATSSSTASTAPSTLDKQNSPTVHSRPTLYLSKYVPQAAGGNNAAGVNAKKAGKQKFKLDVVRFTWSDVRLWTEIDRILKLDSSHNHPHSHFSSPSSNVAASKWSDPVRLYEDVCVLCASFWLSSGLSIGANSNSDTWKPSGAAISEEDWSGSEEREGAKMRNIGMGIGGKRVSDGKRERNADGTLRVRNLGLGIEGRPGKSKSKGVVDTPPTPTRQPSASTAKDSIPGGYTDEIPALLSGENQNEDEDDNERDDEERLQRLHIRTTLALLQTFHAHTSFIVSQLREIISQASSVATTPPGQLSRASTAGKAKAAPGSSQINQSLIDFDDANTIYDDDRDADTVVLTPKDLLALDLGIMSDLDARFVEWLAVAEELAVPEGANIANSEYNTRLKKRVVVKRNWKDVVGFLLGLN